MEFLSEFPHWRSYTAGESLKIVSTMSVGYNHIDIEECKKRRIVVGNTPDVLTDATAELGVALLLATSRRLFQAAHSLRMGQWGSWDPTYMVGKGNKRQVLLKYSPAKKQ